MKYYVYILYSLKSDKYYVGSTSDYKARLEHHNTTSDSTYTSKHRPWVMKAVFEVGESRSQAMRIEKFIKRQKSREFIERLLSEDFEPTGKLAQLVRVPNLRD